MSANNSYSCACGQVKVEVLNEAPCIFSAICHCNNCREITGAAYLWANGWLPEHIKVTGETISYTHEVNVRHSCQKCGSFMYEPCPTFNMVMLPAVRLKPPTPPAIHVFVKDKVYTLPDDGLPRFDTMPPLG